MPCQTVKKFDDMCIRLSQRDGRRDDRNGIFLTRSRVFSCSTNSDKRSFYHCANTIFGKVGRLASEETILQLIKTRCVPMLLHGLETTRY